MTARHRPADDLPAMIRFARRRMAEEVRAARRVAGHPVADMVLADVADRRQLLAWVEGYAQRRDNGRWGFAGGDSGRHARSVMEGIHEHHAYVLRYLLGRYAGHPRFRDEWRVSE